MERNRILLLDMYGVIIKESKGYFIPYTYEHFPETEYDKITKIFRQDKSFTKAQLGEITSDEFLGMFGYEDTKETMRDYLKNHLTLDEQFTDFAEKYSVQMEFNLLSNDVSEWSEFLTEYHQLNSYFSDKIVSGDVAMRKPDKNIFLHTIERLKCKPEDCIFVDNSVKNLLVAEEVGMQTVLFDRDGEEYDGIVVNDFRELGMYLESV